MPEKDQHVPTITELVNHLFHTFRRTDGSEFPARVVALAVGEIGHQTIQALRSGRNKNPERTTLLALATFFEIDPRYFFPELEGTQYRPVPPIDSVSSAHQESSISKTTSERG
jgi:hypothetical protein